MTQRRSDYLFDHDSKRLHIHHTEDVEPVIQDVKGVNDLGRNGFSQSRNWRKIGSIPMIEVERVLRERGVNLLENSPAARREVRRYLNENKFFRIPDRPV